MAAIDLLADDEPVDLLAEEPNKNESRGMKALKGIGEDWLHFGRNLASGGLEGLRGIGNIPHQLHLPYAPYFEPTARRAFEVGSSRSTLYNSIKSIIKS